MIQDVIPLGEIRCLSLLATQSQIFHLVAKEEGQLYLLPLRQTLQSVPLSNLPTAESPSEGRMTPGSIRSRKKEQIGILRT